MYQEDSIKVSQAPLYCCPGRHRLLPNQQLYTPTVGLEGSRCASRYLYDSERQCLQQFDLGVVRNAYIQDMSPSVSLPLFVPSNDKSDHSQLSPFQK